jgi:hypothetical protein
MQNFYSCPWIAIRPAGMPAAPGVQPTMANAEPAQNKTVRAVAMNKRKEEKFVVADDIANSCNGWTFSNTLHLLLQRQDRF